MIDDTGFEQVGWGPAITNRPNGLALGLLRQIGNRRQQHGSRRATPRTRGVPRSPSSGETARSARPWTGGPPAPTYSLSTPPSGETYQASQQNFQVLVDGKRRQDVDTGGDEVPQLHDPRVHPRRRDPHDHLPGSGQCRRRQHRLHRQIAVTVTAPRRQSTIGDPGFEQVQVGAGKYQFDPTGSPWDFSTRASLATTAVSRRAIPPHPRGSRSHSSRPPARSARVSPGGQPAPTCSPSTPRSEETPGVPGDL